MNTNAINILSRFTLPSPKIYEVAELNTMPLNQNVYVRSTNQQVIQSGVMSIESILHLYKSVNAINQGSFELVVEPIYNFICSGVTLVKPNFVYSELVAGHLIALLRRGLCGARVLYYQSEIETSFKVFQGWSATQNGIHGYQWGIDAGPDDMTISQVVDEVMTYVQFRHSGLLLEWFKHPGGITFCDAWDTGLDDFGDELCFLADTKRDLLIYANNQDNSFHESICDGFDVDLRPSPKNGTKLIACNASLLCHYVKHNLNKDISIVLGNHND
jgi:hypothetical protein